MVSGSIVTGWGSGGLFMLPEEPLSYRGKAVGIVEGIHMLASFAIVGQD